MKFVILAGPQSSGKTTAFNYLQKIYSDNLDSHYELNQTNVFQGVDMGCIAVTSNMEEKICFADIERVRSLVEVDKVQLYETAMFHLVYSQLLAPRVYSNLRGEYKKSFAPHNLHIIFIDTPPDTTFARRKHIYEERIDKAIQKGETDGLDSVAYKDRMLTKYKKRMVDLYPHWHSVLQEIDYADSTTIINNNHDSKEKFLQDLKNSFEQIIS